MEISWYIILNIISIIFIKGCKSIQEKEYRNLINPNAESENYISVNISSHDTSNNFHIISTELSGVDSILLFPKPKVKIGEILDHNTSLWKREEDQKFLLGIISSSSHRNIFIINLIIKCSSGIKYATYLFKSKQYELISSFQYLDEFIKLKPISSPKDFTLDLAKVKIPEILDLNTMIDIYKINLFIPCRKYRARVVKFGRNKIFDGTSDNRHVPIIIGYEYQGRTYINMFVADGDGEFGYIYKYRLRGMDFVFVSKSDRRVFFEIFTHQIGRLSFKAKPKDLDESYEPKTPSRRMPSFVDDKATRADSVGDIEDIDIPRISVDIFNVSSQFIKTETHKIMNLETVKYTPVGAIITSVNFDMKVLWTATDDEVKCSQISVHSVNGQKHGVELMIQKKDGKIISRTIPYSSVVSAEDFMSFEDEQLPPPPPSTPFNELVDEDSASISCESEEDEEEDNENKEEKEVEEEKETKERDEENKEQQEEDAKILHLKTPPPTPRRKPKLKIKIPKNEEMGSTPPNSPARKEAENEFLETPPPSPAKQETENVFFETTPPNSPARAQAENEFFETTPPNSPAKDQAEMLFLDTTPPNSPARTPPPSPARSPKNSISSDELLLDVDLEKIRATVFKTNYQFVPEQEEASTSDEITPSEDGTTYSVDPEYLEAVSAEKRYQDKYGELYGNEKKEKKKGKKSKDDDIIDSVDISSEKSMHRMRVVDGTPLVPFVLLYPREKFPIRSVYDGYQCIWSSTNESQIIKYVSLFLKDNKPAAMAIMIFEKPGVKYRYFLKDTYEWFEVSPSDYFKSTEYEFKKPENEEKENKEKEENSEVKSEENKEDKKEVKKDENVIHVSIMVPVILGTLFLVLWVGAMLFIIFFF